MIICCLDQSTKVTGYSLWDGRNLIGHGAIDVSYITSAQIRTPEMYRSVKCMLNNINPDIVIIEETQFQSNQKTFRTLAQLQGLMFAIMIDMGIGYMAVEPTIWKSYVGIKAKKREEQKLETMDYVKSRYNLDVVIEDEADAIAIGIWATENIE